MKNLISIVGLIFVIFGVSTFAYKGYNYTTQEQVAKIGDIQITAEREKSIYFPPVLGGLSVGVGIVLIVVSRIGRPK